MRQFIFIFCFFLFETRYFADYIVERVLLIRQSAKHHTKEVNHTESFNLPMMAMKDIPTPAPDAKQITALVKESGRITGYQLSDGQILNKPDAIQLARAGGIRGVGVSSRNGNEYLKSLPDADESNNLGNLPAVTQE